jgi:crossover junction endodeoxyribonuclease RuvC
MMVLGIDPGSRKTGYGLVERRGSALRVVAHGTLVLGDDALEQRLMRLHAGLCEVVTRFGPNAAAVEDIFQARNARSSLRLGHARGVAFLALAQHGLAIHEYAPAMVKRAVTTSGRADKGQIRRMVALILGLDELPSEDAADALAVAVCHAQHAHLMRQPAL